MVQIVDVVLDQTNILCKHKITSKTNVVLMLLYWDMICATNV